jgi:hypothetical protein
MARVVTLVAVFLLILTSMTLTIGFNQGYIATSPSEAAINESVRDNATDINWNERPERPVPVGGVSEAPPRPVRSVFEWGINVALLAADHVAAWAYANKTWLPLPVAQVVAVAPTFIALALAGYRIFGVFSR